MESESEGKRRLMFQVKDTPAEKEKSPLFIQPFVLFRPSTNWMTLTLGKAICFTQSTKSNVNLTLKHPHRHTQEQRLTKDLRNPWPSQVDTKK